MDKLAFLAGATDAADLSPAPAPAEAPGEPTPAPEPQEATPRPRDEQGRFAPASSEAAGGEASRVEGEAARQPPLSDKELGGTLKALLDTRDRAQAAERERDALKSQLAEHQAKLEAQANPPSVEAQLEARLYAQNLTMSRRFAEKEYGKDEVATVHEWAAARCDADPVFNAQMRSSDHPYEDAMRAWNREQIVSKVTPERLAAFEAWEKGRSAAPADPTATPAPSPAPPRSLATASGTGAAGAAHVPTHPGAAFEAAIR